MLDSNVHLPHNLLEAGLCLSKYSAYDLAWQSLHMAAAAACRGSINLLQDLLQVASTCYKTCFVPRHIKSNEGFFWKSKVALLQEDLVAVTTRWWQETPLTRRLVFKFVPRLLTTVTQRFLYMERKARPHRTEWPWAGFTTTAVTMQPMEEVRRLVLKKLSGTKVTVISASVAVESSIHNSSVTRAIKLIVVGN